MTNTPEEKDLNKERGDSFTLGGLQDAEALRNLKEKMGNQQEEGGSNDDRRDQHLDIPDKFDNPDDVLGEGWRERLRTALERIEMENPAKRFEKLVEKGSVDKEAALKAGLRTDKNGQIKIALNEAAAGRALKEKDALILLDKLAESEPGEYQVVIDKFLEEDIDPPMKNPTELRKLKKKAGKPKMEINLLKDSAEERDQENRLPTTEKSDEEKDPYLNMINNPRAAVLEIKNMVKKSKNDEFNKRAKKLIQALEELAEAQRNSKWGEEAKLKKKVAALDQELRSVPNLEEDVPEFEPRKLERVEGGPVRRISKDEARQLRENSVDLKNIDAKPPKMEVPWYRAKGGTHAHIEKSPKTGPEKIEKPGKSEEARALKKEAREMYDRVAALYFETIERMEVSDDLHGKWKEFSEIVEEISNSANDSENRELFSDAKKLSGEIEEQLNNLPKTKTEKKQEKPKLGPKINLLRDNRERSPLTPEAHSFIASVKRGEGVPKELTDDIKRILKENGFNIRDDEWDEIDPETAIKMLEGAIKQEEGSGIDKYLKGRKAEVAKLIVEKGKEAGLWYKGLSFKKKAALGLGILAATAGGALVGGTVGTTIASAAGTAAIVKRTLLAIGTGVGTSISLEASGQRRKEKEIKESTFTKHPKLFGALAGGLVFAIAELGDDAARGLYKSGEWVSEKWTELFTDKALDAAEEIGPEAGALTETISPEEKLEVVRSHLDERAEEVQADLTQETETVESLDSEGVEQEVAYNNEVDRETATQEGVLESKEVVTIEISEGSNVWDTTRELAKQEGLSTKEFNEAWNNSFHEIDGQEVHFSDINLVHEGDKISLTREPFIHFEIEDNPNDSFKIGTDLPEKEPVPSEIKTDNDGAGKEAGDIENISPEDSLNEINQKIAQTLNADLEEIYPEDEIYETDPWDQVKGLRARDIIKNESIAEESIRKILEGGNSEMHQKFIEYVREVSQKSGVKAGMFETIHDYLIRALEGIIEK